MLPSHQMFRWSLCCVRLREAHTEEASSWKEVDPKTSCVGELSSCGHPATRSTADKSVRKEHNTHSVKLLAALSFRGRTPATVRWPCTVRSVQRG